MKRTIQTVLHDLGQIIQVLAAMGVPALLMCAAFDEWYLMPGFFAMIVLSFGLGQVLARMCSPAEHVSPAAATLTVALAWAVAPVLAALPFYSIAFVEVPVTGEVARFGSFTNALFEATSGFTATGLTMAVRESELPHALQWWRSSIEWVGGIGVILLALLVLDPAEGRASLFTTEANIGRFAEQTGHTIRNLWKIFGGYTLAAVLAFWAVGMPFWEALNHGLTGIATGGFVVTDESFTGYSSAIKLVGMAVTLAGAVSFSVHYLLLVQHKWRAALRDVQVVTMGVLLVLGTAALALANGVGGGPQVPFIDTAFQWVSGWGTCGFYSADLSAWTQAALFVLIAGMFVGGASGSTTGGFKLKRLALLSKSILWRLQDQMRPQGSTYRFAGEVLDKEEMGGKLHVASALLLLFLLTLLAGTLALLLMVGDRYPLAHLLFDAASALGTVGLSAGVTGPDLYDPAKYVLMALMYAGRLEITAVLVLLAAPWAVEPSDG